MNKIITRAKLLIDIYVAALNIYNASLAIGADDTQLLPLYVEFDSDYVSHVTEVLKSIAKSSGTLRPDIAEQCNVIIENLDIIEREYNRLQELAKLESSDAIKNAVQTLEDTFTCISLDNGDHCFYPNIEESWFEVYSKHFEDLIKSLFDYIVHESGSDDDDTCNGEVDHSDMVEVLKLAIAASKK